VTPPIEPWPEYERRLRLDEQAASYALVVDAPMPRYVGPFSSTDAAFSWNAEHRDGADARVVTLHAPWRPWREPPRPVDVEHGTETWTPEMAACLQCRIGEYGRPEPCERHR
jgi:hypothetical protein